MLLFLLIFLILILFWPALTGHVLLAVILLLVILALFYPTGVYRRGPPA